MNKYHLKILLNTSNRSYTNVKQFYTTTVEATSFLIDKNCIQFFQTNPKGYKYEVKAVYPASNTIIEKIENELES